MKKAIILTFAALMGTMGSHALAQRPQRGEPRPEPRREITDLVSDLGSTQKRQLDAITAESKDRVDKLRKEQKIVRDSINRLMEMEGDQSRILFPLFDREAKLQAEISREMYVTKVRIDEVLNPEQRKELQSANRRHHREKKKR